MIVQQHWQSPVGVEAEEGCLLWRGSPWPVCPCVQMGHWEVLQCLVEEPWGEWQGERKKPDPGALRRLGVFPPASVLQLQRLVRTDVLVHPPKVPIQVADEGALVWGPGHPEAEGILRSE